MLFQVSLISSSFHFHCVLLMYHIWAASFTTFSINWVCSQQWLLCVMPKALFFCFVCTVLTRFFLPFPLLSLSLSLFNCRQMLIATWTWPVKEINPTAPRHRGLHHLDQDLLVLVLAAGRLTGRQVATAEINSVPLLSFPFRKISSCWMMVSIFYLLQAPGKVVLHQPH